MFHRNREIVSGACSMQLLLGGPLVGGPLLGSPLLGSPLLGSPLLGSPLLGSKERRERGLCARELLKADPLVRGVRLGDLARAVDDGVDPVALEERRLRPEAEVDR